MSHTPIDQERLDEIIDNICSINNNAPEINAIKIDLEFEARDLGVVLASFIDRKFKMTNSFYKEGMDVLMFEKSHFTFSRHNREVYIKFI